MQIQPVILAGGGGTRLWPLSREGFPKQFLKLDSELTLLQQTLSRLPAADFKLPGMTVAAPLVICNDEHRFFVLHQAGEIGISPGGIVLEPARRNTAPALTVAALLQAQADTVLVIMPADHRIGDVQEFRKALAGAVGFAAAGGIVVFGVAPTRPETGYGYIQSGQKLNAPGVQVEAFRVERFVEKPDAGTALKYVQGGTHLWNSGMFVVRADVWLRAIERRAPAILAACRQAVAGATPDQDFLRLERAAFESCPADSVDYAVMEHATEMRDIDTIVIRLTGGWSDVGSWAGLWESQLRDENQNLTHGDVCAIDVHNSTVRSEHRLVAALGVQDLVIVETADAVLVASRERSEDVKAVVDWLKEEGREERLYSRRVYRPWGSFETIDQGERFTVKRITVSPGHALSLQMHHHRAEHWIVVRGTATVVRGDDQFTLNENESTYIPTGVRHRLSNPGKIPLEIIEVQSGSYLGEDDIVRFDDAYNRK